MVHPWTALPFGALLTGADLPTAFPYFIAIERLLDARVPAGDGLLILAGYALIYCLPCFALLVVGSLARDRRRTMLIRITTGFRTGDVRASRPIAIVLMLLAAAAASLPSWALNR